MVRSDLFAGYEHSEARILVYHRLIVWAGAGMIRLFGFGLPQLRLVSLVSAGALLALLSTKRGMPDGMARFGPPATLLCMLLFFRFAGYYRPEVMLAMLAWVQWLLISRAARTGSTAFTVLAGAACGLGILSHLNGMAFAAGSVAVLLASRHRGLLPAFIGAALISGLGPLVVDAARDFPLLESQFTGEFVRTKTSLSPLTPLWNMVREHQRLFRDPEMILITLSTIAAFFSGGRRRFAQAPLYYGFWIASFIALATVTGSKSTKYAIPLMPFAACEIWAGLEHAASRKAMAAWRRWPAVILAASLAVSGMVSAVRFELQPAEDIAAESRVAGCFVPDGSACVAPMDLIFDELGRIRIYGLYYAERLGGEEGLTPSGILQYARERDAEYLVMDSASAARAGALPEGDFLPLRLEFPRVYRMGDI